jgi:hypothetical protein
MEGKLPMLLLVLAEGVEELTAGLYFGAGDFVFSVAEQSSKDVDYVRVD